MNDTDDLTAAIQEIDVGASSDPNETTTGDDVRDQADDAVDAATESHQAAEGVETASGGVSTDGLKQALLSTGPETPLSQVESPWDPEQGGVTRIYRGLQKALDFDGTPAVVDLAIGAVEAFQNFEPAGAEQENGEDNQPLEPGGGV